MKYVPPRVWFLYTLAMLPIVLQLLFAENVAAANRCVADASAAYENAFCELKKHKSGSVLPTLGEFRRNPPTMQYLLIKRLAERQGIELVRPKASSSVRRKQAPTTVTTPSTPFVASHEPPKSLAEPSACRYWPRRIECGQHVFLHQPNKTNAKLAKGVLDAGNTLQLGKVPTQNEQDWLAGAYERYLRAMLSIGLAGSSFTYSGFAHTFYEHQAQGTDFSERFAQMFEYLKRDKKQLAVSVKRPGRAPTADECEWLSTELLVCNSQAMNLVYLLSNEVSNQVSSQVSN